MLLLEKILLEGAIEQAIQNGYQLSFVYDGLMRQVEPFTMGIHKTTNNMHLIAYQVGGDSRLAKGKYIPHLVKLSNKQKKLQKRRRSANRKFPEQKQNRWRSYLVQKMENIRIIHSTSRSFRPGYNPPDVRLSNIKADFSQYFVADPNKPIRPQLQQYMKTKEPNEKEQPDDVTKTSTTNQNDTDLKNLDKSLSLQKAFDKPK